ncbi:hypothetical protein H6H01_11860 [Nostoc calcicola FACHB-3891]|nr:hypothetical protein [Nostoc calcicola FACHB-3891]MDZ8056741.1 hypothetical protein [Nostoc sp. EkiNYC01]
MINQHLQTAILPPALEVTATVFPSEEAHSNAIAELQEFIALRPNARDKPSDSSSHRLVDHATPLLLMLAI